MPRTLAALLAAALLPAAMAHAERYAPAHDPATLSGLEVAVGDLDLTMRRARYATSAFAAFHPAASSALAEAEEARLEVTRLALRGDVRGALWQAGEAREAALLVLEHVDMAQLDLALAALPPAAAKGSGGDVR